VLISQPTAGIEEILMKHFLYQTDAVTTFATTPAFELVFPEGQRWCVVVVETAQSLVSMNLNAKALRHTLA
jgi:hypothetical protein